MIAFRQIYECGSAAHRLVRGRSLFAALFVWIGWSGPVGSIAAGQALPDTVHVRSFIDGRSEAGPERDVVPRDSLPGLRNRVLEGLRASGFYLAYLDSLQVEGPEEAPAMDLYFTRGPDVRVGEVRLHGVPDEMLGSLYERMDTRTGSSLDPSTLVQDVDRMLDFLGGMGYASAAIVLEGAELARESEEQVLHLDIDVQPGERLILRNVVLPGSDRTSPLYVMRIAQVRPGRWIQSDLDDIRQELEATGFYAEVGRPYLVRVDDERADLYIPVVEEPPGAFDLVLGYQPPVESNRGGVVGSGHLILKNLFGHGRLMAMKLNRLPGQISRFNARYADPFIAGLPFGIDVMFEGVQQDSTYGQQTLRGGLAYRLSGGVAATVTVSREQTRPGQAGLRITPGTRRQAVPRSDGWFYGLRLEYRSTDHIVNPRRGVTVATAFERGRKNRISLLRTEAGDTTTERSTLRQERLELSIRTYLPVFRRQVAVIGGDAQVLRSTSYDLSDLLRFGGATTLRGYDEERFLGRFVGRMLAEYRYQVDRASYVFLFFDLGYVETPAAADLEADRSFYPGYGFGMQFSTGLGLINLSYALSSGSRPVDGKVHIGLSVGL